MTDKQAKITAIEILIILRRRATDFGGFVSGDRKGETECVNAILPIISDALAARERAVWLEAAEAYERYVQSRIPKAGDWKPPQPFAAWCRQQAEAVKP